MLPKRGMSLSRFDGASARKDFIPFFGWEDTRLVGLEEAVKDLPVPRIRDYAGASVDYADDYLRRHGGIDPRGMGREAIAAFTAAKLANSNAMATAVTACRLGWVAYVIPFVFVFSPSLIMRGGTIEVVVSFVCAVVGVWIASEPVNVSVMSSPSFALPVPASTMPTVPRVGWVLSMVTAPEFGVVSATPALPAESS